MKKLPTKLNNLGCLVLSLICAIPFIGAFIGTFLVAPTLIGHSLRYGKVPAVKVLSIFFITAIFYVAAAVTLMSSGHYLGAFAASTVITFAGLKIFTLIENSFEGENAQVVV
ncbi:hypothetical protein UY775_23990 [Escherichia coli]|nr:hypothetical protein [Escherichia coli]MDY8699291.1 hypothetical protein [Escherichia coli]MDY8726689.1 hypothetical protein [Escherichia coli]MDY8846944.1 hypothetical protein [Escherichia coli]